MTERARAMDESELRVLGIDALNKALGPAEALRFLTLFHREPTDSVEVSKKHYENQSMEGIFKRAKCIGEAEIQDPSFPEDTDLLKAAIK
jgi:hypothetical protein